MNTAIVEVDRPWLAMSSMLIGAFVGMLSETSLNIALPTLGRVFSVGTGTLQWLVTGYMLMIGHCAAVFKSDFKVVFNPSDHHLRFG